MTRPSAARVYDYFLGGAHNFEVDRQLAEQVARVTPNVGEAMRANRAFLRRAVTFLVDQGIRQFLDIGSGIPTVGNVHEVAQAAAPETRVVYVDIDPIAVAQSRSILRDNERAGVICADLREPQAILDQARALDLIDFDRPVAILLVGVIHFVADADSPAKLVQPLREAAAPGSYLVISHATADGQPPELLDAQRLSARTATEVQLRTGSEIATYFDGFDLVEPGLVFINFWRPEPDEDSGRQSEPSAGYAGIGRRD